MKFFKPKFWDEGHISIFSILLFPAALLFRLISFTKNLFIRTEECSIPVICVGNIYLGGTGKTPLCIEIFTILKNLNMKPAFIRKEYISFNDEVMLQKKVGPIYQNKKRLEALKSAIENKINVAILDDGFQDFSIKKNLCIVCFDEKRWIGNGFIIPAGPLREGLSSLKRANCVIINGKKNTTIENQIHNQNSKVKIYYVEYKGQNINEFTNKRVIAFAGIGNPSNFFNLLKDNNINIEEKIEFPDHYNYSKVELENLIKRAETKKSVLLTTEKDYLRIGENYQRKINFLRIAVDIKNQDEFVQEIKKII